jgi:hypothetical protein
MNEDRPRSSKASARVPGDSGSRVSMRLVVLSLSYCVVMGMVTTALGALAASGVTGRVKVVVWVGVTVVLAVGAIGIADTVIFALLGRSARSDRRSPGFSGPALPAHGSLEADHGGADGNEERRPASHVHFHQHRRLVHPDVADRS